MKKPIVSMIAALDDAGGIGKNGKLLFRISSDLRRFAKITAGHAVIMGRVTYDSLKPSRKPLPNRTNIVVTRNHNFVADKKVLICFSLPEALARARGIEKDEIFIIGGAQIYRQGLKHADRLYLTKVKGDYGADKFFPPYKTEFSKVISEVFHEENGYKYRFLILERN